MNSKKIVAAIVVVCSTLLAINSCTHSPYALPAAQQTSDPEICFERDILPIFVSNCAKSNCHNSASHAEGYTLDSYAGIVKKGIVPGNPAASKIWESIAITTSGEKAMPQNAPALSASDLYLIRRWITAGAVAGGTSCSIITCDSNNFTYSGAIQPLMKKYCTGCHFTGASEASLENYNDVKTEVLTDSLYARVSRKAGFSPMPASIPLTDCQVAQVRKWITAGMPNN